MSFFESLFLSPKNRIGDITIQATLEEVLTDTLQATEHPVEAGAPISDHAYLRPSEVVIKCGWSNSTFGSLLSAAESLISGGEVSAQGYVGQVYSKLRALQEKREPFDIQTSKRLYSNMLLTSVSATTDQQTGSVLMVTAVCQQIIIVSTKATTLPAKDAQADPASTAETENAGTKQAVPATPSPGGAVKIPGVNVLTVQTDGLFK